MANPIIKIIGNSLNVLSYISTKKAAVIALNLFSTPRQGRYNESQKAFINTAKKTTLKYKTIDIATYNWTGSGKTVLLAHGWESNTHRWEDLIVLLQAQNYNIIALDAPAHGNTSGKIFNALLYSECINIVANHYKPSILIGHSVGGMASGFFQYKYKNQGLEKIISLGAPATFTGVFKRYVEMMHYNSRIENGLNNLVLERFNNLPSYYSFAEFSKEIETKTLIIHDKKDRIIPYQDAQLLVKKHKNATLITTTGYGHGLRNEAVYKHVLKFIES